MQSPASQVNRKTVSEETIRKYTIGFHNTLDERALKLKSKDVKKLKSWLNEQPQLPYKAMQEMLFAETRKTVSEDTIREYTIGFYYTIKRVSVPSPNLDLPKQLLKEFACWFLDHVAREVDKLLFVNDTGFGIEMRTNFGRSLNGDLIRVRGPKFGSRHYTSICAFGCDYVPHSKMQEGSVNTADMLLFLNEVFDKLPSVGYTLIMDNVKFQRTNEVQELIHQRDHYLTFLPRYPPFLDAIEDSFNEWKDKIRNKNPKDEVELVSLIAEVNRSREICHNYFLHIQEICQKILVEEKIFNNDRT